MTAKEFKTAFHDLVIDMIMEDNSDKDFMKFKSILGMVNTLICDRKENDLTMVLRFHFPEYYKDYKPYEVNE